MIGLFTCAFGDSVMQGSGPTLYNTLPAAIPGIVIDAEPNRQFRHGIGLVDQCSAASAPHILIVHLGTNGLFSDHSFDQLMAAAVGAHRVLFVNLCAPREWVPEANRRLASGVDRHRSSADLIDWLGCVESSPGLLHADGFHMNRRGAAVYAEILAGAVAAAVAAI